MDDDCPNWVRESRFGVWFLNTEIWLNYVLKTALNDLDSLFSIRREKYPLIVDAGCGHGNAFQLLDEKFFPEKIVALDVDPQVLRHTRDNSENLYCQVEVIITSLESIRLPDKSVDLVFCHQTFHHLVHQELALGEFFRILKPEGVLLFAESCQTYITSLPIRLLFRHPQEVQKTADEYLALIRETGFVFDQRNVSFPYSWWSRRDLGLMERLGFSVPTEREETLVNVVANRP